MHMKYYANVLFDVVGLARLLLLFALFWSRWCRDLTLAYMGWTTIPSRLQES